MSDNDPHIPLEAAFPGERRLANRKLGTYAVGRLSRIISPETLQRYSAVERPPTVLHGRSINEGHWSFLSRFLPRLRYVPVTEAVTVISTALAEPVSRTHVTVENDWTGSNNFAAVVC